MTLRAEWMLAMPSFVSVQRRQSLFHSICPNLCLSDNDDDDDDVAQFCWCAWCISAWFLQSFGELAIFSNKFMVLVVDVTMSGETIQYTHLHNVAIHLRVRLFAHLITMCVCVRETSDTEHRNDVKSYTRRDMQIREMRRYARFHRWLESSSRETKAHLIDILLFGCNWFTINGIASPPLARFLVVVFIVASDTHLCYDDDTPAQIRIVARVNHENEKRKTKQ